MPEPMSFAAAQALGRYVREVMDAGGWRALAAKMGRMHAALRLARERIVWVREQDFASFTVDGIAGSHSARYRLAAPGEATPAEMELPPGCDSE